MQPQSNLRAAFWMAGSLACMIVMTWAGRETTRALNVFQVMEMRSVLGLVMLMPLVVRAGGLRAMATRRPLAHISRNVAHYTGQGLWLAALAMIPLSPLVAIEFTAPLWTVLLATAFLGERLNGGKVAAVVLGIAGVLVIVRPGTGNIGEGHVIVLAAAFAFACSYALVKSLTRTESVVKIIFWMLVIQSVIGLAPALVEWRTPDAALWPWIVAISFGGSYAHYCTARAMVHADATVVIPMDFFRVPATAALGYLAYGEAVDALTVAGTALILAGNVFNLAWRRDPKVEEVAAPVP